MLEFSQLMTPIEIEPVKQEVVQPFKKEIKVDVDLFVQLKKGTISDYYETGEVLGEGIK